MAAFWPVSALPCSRCAAATRPRGGQALQSSRVSAGSPDPQAGPAPELPRSKGGAGSKGADAHSQQQRRVSCSAAADLRCTPLSTAPMQGFPRGRRISPAAAGGATPGGPTDPERRPSRQVCSKLPRA